MQEYKKGDLDLLMPLMGVYIAVLVCANVLASKLFVIGGKWVMTAGIIAYPMTFLITDIVNEVWGRETANKFVGIGLVANILMVVLFVIGVWLPPAPIWGSQTAFQDVLGSVPRLVLASMAAYITSQTWDVWVFDYIKRKMRLGLWFRNNASTITSQVIDSAVFLTIGFAGVMPREDLIVMFVTYVVAKFIIAVIDTPFAYLGVALVRRYGKDD